MEFDLDEALLGGDRTGTGALEPSNAASTVATSPRARRAIRRRRRIVASGQGGTFTGAKATALLASAGDDAQPLHLRAEAAAKASHLLGKVTSFLLPPIAMHALEASRRLALPAPSQP